MNFFKFLVREILDLFVEKCYPKHAQGGPQVSSWSKVSSISVMLEVLLICSYCIKPTIIVLFVCEIIIFSISLGIEKRQLWIRQMLWIFLRWYFVVSHHIRRVTFSHTSHRNFKFNNCFWSDFLHFTTFYNVHFSCIWYIKQQN